MATFTKNFYFNLRRDYQKNSYERRAYDSVDEKSLSLAIYPKKRKKEFGRIKVNDRKPILFNFLQNFECINLNNNRNRSQEKLTLSNKNMQIPQV